MTKDELLASITWKWEGHENRYVVMMAGDPVFFTDNAFQRCLFVAALKAQIHTQALPGKAVDGELLVAAMCFDWGQPSAAWAPCFHLENGRFCGRAPWWDGHADESDHPYVSLADLLRKVMS